ncbi:MAG: LytTR family DNA-binding domain-containing protein [Anaerovorax sp.]
MDKNFSESVRITQFIIVRKRCEVTKVATKEILYMEKELRSIHIYTIYCKHTFYGKMEDISDHLGPSFFRCHKSCVVNFDKIVSMKEGVFYFEGGSSLMIGKNNYQNAKKHYADFLEHNLA